MGKILLLALTLLIGSAIFSGCGRLSTPSPSAQPDEIRIGWQTLWATQGQLVKAMQHTNILALNGLEAKYSGVDYGPQLNSLALAGDVDVIFTADQPAASLLAKGGDWTIIGRLMYNSTRVYVPPDSPIQSMTEIKSVGGPTGAAAERITAQGITAAGGDPRKVNWVTLDMPAQGPIISQGKDWPTDAMYGFDPAAANFIHQRHARELYAGHVVSVVVMSNDYLQNHPVAAYRFAKSFVQAWHYYATHQDQVNAWFKEESRIPFDQEVLTMAASVEPNIKAQSVRDLRPLLNDNDLVVLQNGADFLVDQGATKNRVMMTDFVNQSVMKRAFTALSADYDPGQVKVTN